MIQNPMNVIGDTMVSITIPDTFRPGELLNVKLPDGRFVGFVVPVDAVAGKQYVVDSTHMTLLSAVPAFECVNVIRLKQFLKQQLWPVGLQNALIQSCQKFPLRYFICDNSGSMSAFDIHRLINAEDPQRSRFIHGSRWDELRDFVRYHARLATEAETFAEFRFLNEFSPVSLGIGPDKNNTDALFTLEQILQSDPVGGTPLCRHIREITSLIKENEPALKQAGQQALVVLATDGESSDGDVITALRPLLQLPVWVVVRICTEDERIVQYWEAIDRQMTESKIDIIEDLKIEAREIHQYNPWLTYGINLHRLREFGIGVKDLDAAQIGKCTPNQMKNITALMVFGNGPMELPDPVTEFPKFMRMIQSANDREGLVYCPLRKSRHHWIHMPDLRRQYDPNGGCCSLS